jgi:crossover junction endodeoxyribonuclease RuvC
MKNAKGIQRFRALGIDPGLAVTGFAVVGTFAKGGELCNWGDVKTSSKLPIPERLQVIYRRVDQIVQDWNPTIMVVEDVYVLDKYPKAAIQLGEVKGVIYLAAQDNNLEVVKIRPTELKRCLTGNGRAAKDQVNRAVKKILGLNREIKPDHASDAAALALIGLSRKGYYVW